MTLTNKNRVVDILCIFFGVLLLIMTVKHIIDPAVFLPMIPPFILAVFAHIFATVCEFFTGLMLLIPKYRKFGAVSFTILMTVFLPLHGWDLFRKDHTENPVFPNLTAAVIRFVIQLIVISTGWWMFKIKSKTDFSKN